MEVEFRTRIVDRVVRIDLTVEQARRYHASTREFLVDVAEYLNTIRESVVPVSVVFAFEGQWMDSLPALIVDAVENIGDEEAKGLGNEWVEVMVNAWMLR